MPLTIQTLSGTSNKESAGLMDPIQSSKMQIPTVEQISGASFPDQLIHDPRIVDVAVSDNHHSGNIAAQVKQCMELHCRFVATELSPREKRQTQIDDGRVERVDGLLQFQTKRFIRVQLTSVWYQDERSQRRSANRAPDSRARAYCEKLDCECPCDTAC